MISNANLSSIVNSPVRTIMAKVELYTDSTLVNTFSYDDKLKSLTIERVGENKFFGFGICQKLNIHLLDVNRELAITTADSLKVYFNDVNTTPIFYVTEVHRSEITNELSITAYDFLYKAAEHTISELELTAPYTINTIASSIGWFLGDGFTASSILGQYNPFTLSFEEGANFDGAETLREVLNAVADATQTVYYVRNDNKLMFENLAHSNSAVYTIDKSMYITLDSGDNRRLATITHATELGDNVSISTVATGSTQFVWDNPFWELRDDIDTLLNYAIEAVGGLTINEFNCEWRGNPLLEPCDKISFVTKDNVTVNTYLLNDVISYDGSLKQETMWSFDINDTDTESNPSNLGEALKKTFARVDKANKQIDLVVSDVNIATEDITNLQLTTDGITASVQEIKDITDSSISNLSGDIESLTSIVESKVSAEDVTIAIRTELDNGVDKVVTSTGFTFDETGLTVSKSGSEMSTTITEDGMIVYKEDEAMLTANNIGVNATNLHATTYLIIGNNSRFEDYKEDRTACFWIGG